MCNVILEVARQLHRNLVRVIAHRHFIFLTKIDQLGRYGGGPVSQVIRPYIINNVVTMLVFCIVHLHIIMLNLFMQNCVCLHRFIVILLGLSHLFFTVLQARQSTVLPPYMGLVKAYGELCLQSHRKAGICAVL